MAGIAVTGDTEVVSSGRVRAYLYRMNEAALYLQAIRRRLCLLRMAIHGAVGKQPDAWQELGLILGEVEDLAAVSQEGINRLGLGASIPNGGLFEEGPTEADPIN